MTVKIKPGLNCWRSQIQVYCSCGFHNYFHVPVYHGCNIYDRPIFLVL